MTLEEQFECLIAVEQLAAGNIKFACGNSWRGDDFESALQPLIKEWCDLNGSNRAGPFAVPDMPVE